MIIQFSVKNYKTFKEKATLSLVASNYDKDTRESENIINLPDKKLRLLKSAVVYGANASGKSKFFDAIAFMRQFVITSSKDSQKNDEIKTDPFRLSTESENEPSEFEIVFISNDILYRYGFEVNKKEVVSEWLFYKPKSKEIQLFNREYQKFEIHPKKFQKAQFLIKEGIVRNNALLLSVAAQFNDELSFSLIHWFDILNIGFTDLKIFSVFFAVTPLKFKLLEFLKVADLGIQELEIKKNNSINWQKDFLTQVEKINSNRSDNNLNDNLLQLFSNLSNNDPKVTTFHKKYDKNMEINQEIEFLLEEDESNGTKRFFELSGHLITSLLNGSILFIDELDSKLHPNLVCHIVALFNSNKSNPLNAQLVFNTHDTNLLNSGLFRRDQIWFTEKNKYGEASLYSLADFKTDEVRKNSAFEENYVRGKYGAVPYLGDFEDFVVDTKVHDNEK